MKQLYSSIIYDSNEIKKLRNNIKECFGTKELEKFDKTLRDIGNTSNGTKITPPIKSNNFGQDLRTALGIGTVALGIRKAVSFFKDANTEAVDYAETVNLFNVAMGKKTDQYGKLDEEASKYYTKAIAFQEKLSDKLHINIEESMNYQALFNSMSKSMGIADEYAYKLSENFTKLGYDLASLYNINTENAMQKLRSGLAGQTKPLRDLGLDITQQSLEPLLDELGIERSVKQLSQAEKMVARYIVVLRQASLAHGDFAKTMDSPANQLRIFNAQLIAFKRNMGSLWQGLLGNILPYVNAIMMVINELLKMVAKLFGYEVWEQDVSISTNIGADDLVDDLGTATQKAKELKKQLMGFDEINNITLPDKTSGGSGGGASVGGIDQRLLDAMKEYDNLMDKVKSKATDIRDKMMDWLGFERDDNGTWKLKEGYTNIEKIRDIAIIAGGILAGWKITNLLSGLSAALKDANKLKGLGVISLVLGAKFQLDALKEFATGKVDSESIIHAILGALGLGIGTAVITGGGITVGLPIAITALITTGLAKVDSELGIDKMLWGKVYDILGFEYSNEASIPNFKVRFNILMDMKDILFNNLSTLLEKLKSWIKETILYQISFLIKCMSDALGSFPIFGERLREESLKLGKIIETEAEREKQTRENLTMACEKNTAIIVETEKLKQAIVAENTENIKQSLEFLGKKYDELGKVTESSLSEQITTQQTFANKVRSIYGETGKEISEETRKNLNERIEILADKLIEQTNKIEILGKDEIEAWRKLAESSEQIYNEKISNVNEDTRLALEAILGKVDISSPEYIQKWANMAKESSEKYNQALLNLPEDTRGRIVASVMAVEGMTESTKIAYSNLSEEGKKAFNDVLTKMETETKQKIQNAITAIDTKTAEAGKAGANLGNSIKTHFDSGLGNANKSAEDFIEGFTRVFRQKKSTETALKEVKSFGKKLVSHFNAGLDEHSPSKETEKSAFYFIKGFTNKIQDMIPSSLQQIKGLALGLTNEFDNNLGISNGIKVNPNDFKIDTNQFIDYGQISGAIATQSNVNVSSDIEGRIENAIYSAFSNVRIPVEIEATTDEGVVFKKVQVKAREFSMQTGEPAFEF